MTRIVGGLVGFDFDRSAEIALRNLVGQTVDEAKVGQENDEKRQVVHSVRSFGSFGSTETCAISDTFEELTRLARVSTSSRLMTGGQLKKLLVADYGGRLRCLIALETIAETIGDSSVLK